MKNITLVSCNYVFLEKFKKNVIIIYKYDQTNIVTIVSLIKTNIKKIFIQVLEKCWHAQTWSKALYIIILIYVAQFSHRIGGISQECPSSVYTV